MNILSLSLDKKILEADSPAQKRQREYGRLFGELHILVLNAGRDIRLDENTWIYGIAGSGKLRRFFGAWRKSGEIIKEREIDLVTTQDPFFLGLIGWRLKKKFKIKFHLQIHTDFLSPYFFRDSFLNKMRRAMALHLIPKAAGIRVVSERIKNSLLAANLKLKTEPIVLPIFVDVQKFKTSLIKISLKKKYPQFNFVILMASRLRREKNISLAIEAVAEILKQHTIAGLIVVGDGKEKNKLQQQVIKNGLQASIIFEPWTDDLTSY